MSDLYTVVIPEHNRPERLKRLLDYYLSFGCKVIVTDSSDLPFKYVNQYKQVYYAYFPKKHLAEKLSLIFDKIDTPYVVMCADDDYIIPSSITKMIDYMQRNPLYKSAQGLYARYYPLDNISLFLEYPQLINNSLDEDDNAARVLHLMSSYYQFYYAVFEKELFIEGINSTIIEGTCKLQNLCLLELYLSMYSAARAKHAILPYLYCLREYIPNSAGSYVPNLDSLLESKHPNQEILFLEEKLSLTISKNRLYGHEIVKQALSDYLKFCNRKVCILKRILLKLDDVFFDKYVTKKLSYYKIMQSVVSRDDTINEIELIKSSILSNYDLIYKQKQN